MSIESGHYGVFYEDCCELTVSEGEGPETKVRGGIGDSSQHELDSLNKLVDNNVHFCGTVTIIILRLVPQQSLSRVRVNKLLLVMMIMSMVLFINRLAGGVQYCNWCFSLFNIL